MIVVDGALTLELGYRPAWEEEHPWEPGSATDASSSSTAPAWRGSIGRWAGDRRLRSTDVGGIDILAMPAGVEDYEELVREAVPVDLGDVVVQVCALPDLIAMKRAAGRPKDLIEVEVLSALRDEIADGR